MVTEQYTPVTVDVKLKIRDVLRYNMYVAYRSWWSRIILVIGVALAIWLGYSMVERTVSLDVFLSQNIVMILVVAFILFGTPFKVWRITATQMQSPIFSGKSHYVFSTEGIRLKIQDMEDTVQWETYSRIVETNKDFRFFVDRVQAQIVPKHNMTTAQVEALRVMIRMTNPDTIYQLKK